MPSGVMTASLGEMYASLTLAGKDAVDRIHAAGDELEHRERQVATATADLHATVVDALDSKVPARFVAELLGVSVSRVYQIRDEVLRHRNH